MSCNCDKNRKDELRIVKGNAFHLRVQVTARRMDGTIIDDFDLGEASPVLTVLYGGTGTETGMVVEGNEAVVYFNGNQGLGWYGLEMSGTWEGEAWRWCVEKVFQIVNTNAKANVPEWAFFTDDSYTIAGTFDLLAAAAAAVQSDWTETDQNSAAFILHKPDLSVYALKSEVSDVVRYSSQTLTDAQKRQVRTNIGAQERGNYVENLAGAASAYTTLIKAGNDSGNKAEVRVQERSVKLEAEAGSVEVSQNGVAVTAGNSGFPNAKMTLNGKEVATKDDVSSVSAQVAAVSEVANAAAPQATTYNKTEVDTALAGKADKATTLAGYGITDAYTKQEVDDELVEKADLSVVAANTEDIAELQEAYAALNQANVVPVAEGDWPLAVLEENTIYRVAGSTSYTDYMWNGTSIIPMATYSNTAVVLTGRQQLTELQQEQVQENIGIDSMDGDTLYVIDPDGNVIAKIDKDGVHSVDFLVGENAVSVTGLISAERVAREAAVGNEVAAREEAVGNEAAAREVAVDSLEASKLDQTIDNDSFSFTDSDGNVVARIDKDGVHSAQSKHAVACMALSESYYPIAAPTRDAAGNITFARVMFGTGVEGSISVAYDGSGNSTGVEVTYGNYQYVIGIERDSAGNVEVVTVEEA